MTNYEKIKGMSVDEMATDYVRNRSEAGCENCVSIGKCRKYHGTRYFDLSCTERIKKWLNSEVE